jgi:DNA-binding MarR family transcriptional regulator
LTFTLRTLYVHLVNKTIDKPEIDPVEGGSSNEVAITLGMLSAIEENSSVSQRRLANDLGIALGLANAYLKRCVKKGWIKVQQVPANRYAYYLTPTGFSEKARLTGEYLTSSLGFFRHAREQSADVCAQAAARGIGRIALAGSGELAEITALTALDSPVEAVGIVDPEKAGGRVAGLQIVGAIEELGRIDAVVVTDMRNPQQTYERWSMRLGADRVLAIPMLKVTRPNRVRVEGGK